MCVIMHVLPPPPTKKNNLKINNLFFYIQLGTQTNVNIEIESCIRWFLWETQIYGQDPNNYFKFT